MKPPIACVPAPDCPACGSTGDPLYSNLSDRLFGIEGTYAMSHCTNTSCGCIWLNPTPRTEDLAKLYKEYTTHQKPQTSSSRRRTLIERVRESIRAEALGYPTTEQDFVSKIFFQLSKLHPTWHDAQLANLFYVPYIKDGLLLDVGCGNGSSMLTMSSQGWNVTGIDFDETAIAAAQSCGLNAAVSDLFSARFPDNHFDAIMMNHVIEHVPNPLEYLKECYRILKPGGTLTALTPNAASRGHQLYKQDWRGLETPRHLQVFTPRALALLAARAGFSESTGFTSTQGILQIFYESKLCALNGTFDVYYSATTLPFYKPRYFIAGLKHRFFPNLSEVAVLRAVKPRK